jgi:flagellin-like protein
MDMKLRKNEEAVSPVIGVILMVVITVIIAALMAAFAFGMGAPTKAPTASIKIISTSVTDNTIRLQHTGGDSLSLNNVKLIVEQTESDGTVTRMSIDQVDTTTPPSKLKTGDTLEVIADGTDITLNLAAGSLKPSTSDGTVKLATGSDVTVSLIDVPSGQEISNAKVSI